MSERFVPKKPGVYWAEIQGPIDCSWYVVAYNVGKDDDGKLRIIDPENEGEPRWDIDVDDVEWTGPAMPPEDVAALQARVTQLEAKCHQQQCEIADLRKELERERPQ